MSIQLMKAENGANLLFGTFSNNRIDREGQILTDAAHKEFIEFLNEHPERAPTLLFWHIDGTDLSQSKAKMWFYKAGFLSMVWEVSDKSAEFITNFDNLFNAGMSHGFNVLQFDDDGDIEQYRTFEASILPLDKAANLYTNIEVLEKEQKRMTPEQMKVAMQTFGSKAAMAIAQELQESEQAANVLDDANVAKKDFDEEIETTEEPQTEAEIVASEAETVAALTALDSKLENVLSSQQEQIDNLADQLATLSKQFTGHKNNGRSRVTLASLAKHFQSKTAIGGDAGVVASDDELVNDKPKHKENTQANRHPLSGLWSTTGGK